MTEQKKFKQRVRERLNRTGETYSTARRVLHQELTQSSTSAAKAGSPDATYSERRRAFREASLTAWQRLATELGGGPGTYTWTSRHEILRVLKLIAERATRNHVHHPDGGGFDLTGAMEGSEPGCITLDMQGIGVVVLPRELTLTIPEQDPLTEWAYYRLETGDLAPTGIYEEVRRDREELVEMAPRAYIHRMHWDTGCYGSDEKGHSIPLPKEARLVFRYLRGPFLIVAKGSTYNASRLTYDGQHAMTTADQFKRMICSTVQDLHQYKIYGVDVLGGETPADHRKPICR